MNLSQILRKKSIYPVRLIANSNDEELNYKKGDEIGIEAIDFSVGDIRCCNKNNQFIFSIFYNKETWELHGDWNFKPIDIAKQELFCNCKNQKLISTVYPLDDICNYCRKIIEIQ